MTDGAIGVVGPRNETAIGNEVLIGREALDAIEFEIDGKRRNLPDAGYPKQTLDIVIGNEYGVEKALEMEDLFVQELDLVTATLELEPVGFRERIGRAPVDGDEVIAVELATEVVDADAAGGVFLNDARDVHA